MCAHQADAFPTPEIEKLYAALVNAVGSEYESVRKKHNRSIKADLKKIQHLKSSIFTTVILSKNSPEVDKAVSLRKATEAINAFNHILSASPKAETPVVLSCEKLASRDPDMMYQWPFNLVYGADDFPDCTSDLTRRLASFAKWNFNVAEVQLRIPFNCSIEDGKSEATITNGIDLGKGYSYRIQIVGDLFGADKVQWGEWKHRKGENDAFFFECDAITRAEFMQSVLSDSLHDEWQADGAGVTSFRVTVMAHAMYKNGTFE